MVSFNTTVRQTTEMFVTKISQENMTKLS